MTERVTAAPSTSLAIWGGRLGDPTRSLTANGSLLAWRICQHRLRAILSLGSHTLEVPSVVLIRTFRRVAAARLTGRRTNGTPVQS